MLLSTTCDVVAQHGSYRHHKQMVDKKPNAAAKLDYVAKACEFPTKNAFAKALGVAPQNIDNWRKRGLTKDAERLLSKTTGVSMDWLNDLSDVAFPHGIKIKIAAPLSKRVERVEMDIDQARESMAALVDALESKLQGITALFLAHLKGSAPTEAYAEKGFHGLLEAYLEHRTETGVVARPSAPTLSVHEPASKRYARK